MKTIGIRLKILGKRIKTIISIKNIPTAVPQSVAFNNRTIADHAAMRIVFNNQFTFIAKKTNSNIKFSLNYTNYLSYSNTNTFFLTTTDKAEISFISSLDSHKSSGPNGIPIKILKLLKKLHFSRIK